MNGKYQNNPIRNAITTGANRLKHLGEWWSLKLRANWNAGDVGSRLVAIAFFLAGLAGILVLAVAMLYLLPLILLATFIAAILFALSANMQRH
jgi:hypothetical protein